TIRTELHNAVAAHGGTIVTTDDVDAGNVDVVFSIIPSGDTDAEAFTLTHRGTGSDAILHVTAAHARGLLYGLYHVVRLGEHAFVGCEMTTSPERHAPHTNLRMLDHWDNIAVDPVTGQVERGYSGGSIFYDQGSVRADLSRVSQYARLLAASGINRVTVNNVNVGPLETRLIGDMLPDLARIANEFRPYGITTHVSVSWDAPARLDGLDTTDPFDANVQGWWREAADRVWATIPDFGGFVITADSEGQPGPLAYGRSPADGANMLSQAVAPHGGLIHWRAFDCNHEQDWRDRTTDRVKAASEHFAPYDGTFADNVIVQIKHDPLNFHDREAVSPVIAAMPNTRVAAEFQVPTEYLGHQKHGVYLGRMWSELLNFPYFAAGAINGHRTMADIVAGHHPDTPSGRLTVGGLAAVSNVGDSHCLTCRPLAQANLYAWGRLAWDPTSDPIDILDDWSRLTFPDAPSSVHRTVHATLDESWETDKTPNATDWHDTINTYFYRHSDIADQQSRTIHSP
ncbi:MAG: alpha-glucuronidase, partial [Cellulomonadaceae bacterium]|nr:alpha-glucuronidase [Cellulomonadaceae bacterium]